MTKIVGLTGGIGSGKTYVASLFKDKGISVYNSDQVAKEIMQNKEVVDQVVSVFGNEILVNKSIDRKKLAEIVFNDTKQLQKLNQLIHPLVQADFEIWTSTQKSIFVIKEAAILFESGAHLQCHINITIEAPIEVRFNRVMHRDQTSSEAVKDRINNQLSASERIKKADYMIYNQDKKSTQTQVDFVYEILKAFVNL